MIVTDDDALAAPRQAPDHPGQDARRRLPHDEVGYNYRLTNSPPPSGSPSSSGSTIRRRQARIAARYDEALGDLPLVLPPRVAGLDSTFWLYSVLVPERRPGRDDLLEHLSGRGIGARALWRPLHPQPPFTSAPVARGTGRRRASSSGRVAALRDRPDGGTRRVIAAVRSFFA